jgi:hypothetical protein
LRDSQRLVYFTEAARSEFRFPMQAALSAMAGRDLRNARHATRGQPNDVAAWDNDTVRTIGLIPSNRVLRPSVGAALGSRGF